MNQFRLHLWREWREHRLALLVLFLVLPLLGWGFARVAPRAVLGDPLVQSGAALSFVVVLLVATGGELLGTERRGPGLQWLERLPSGLNTAFLAKLLFLAITTTVAAWYGLNVARSFALLRGVQPRTFRWEPFFFTAGVSLVVWTFACSVWALRGGVSVFAALLVVGAVGHPLIDLELKGYSLSASQLEAFTWLSAVGGLSGAWLGFVRGGRLSRPPRWSALLGIAPVVPLLLATWSWASQRLQERDVLDPVADNFMGECEAVSEDGRYALMIGRHHLSGWGEEAMPNHALRVDLRHGTWELLGRFQRCQRLSREGEHGLFRTSAIALFFADRTAQVFELETGVLRPHVAEVRGEPAWYALGLGQYVKASRRDEAVVRDPFRGRDYPLTSLRFRRDSGSEILVRPGRWLCRRSVGESWVLYDPDSQRVDSLGWGLETRLLALLRDGRVLIERKMDVSLVEPEAGTSRAVEVTPSRQYIHENAGVRRQPNRGAPDLLAPGPVVLRTDTGWYVLDEDLARLRFVGGGGGSRFVRCLDERSVITSHMGNLYRLDLESGENRWLFPLHTN